MERTMNDVGFDWIRKMEDEGVFANLRKEEKRRKRNIVIYGVVCAVCVIGIPLLTTFATNKD